MLEPIIRIIGILESFLGIFQLLKYLRIVANPTIWESLGHEWILI